MDRQIFLHKWYGVEDILRFLKESKKDILLAKAMGDKQGRSDPKNLYSGLSDYTALGSSGAARYPSWLAGGKNKKTGKSRFFYAFQKDII